MQDVAKISEHIYRLRERDYCEDVNGGPDGNGMREGYLPYMRNVYGQQERLIVLHCPDEQYAGGTQSLWKFFFCPRS